MASRATTPEGQLLGQLFPFHTLSKAELFLDMCMKYRMRHSNADVPNLPDLVDIVQSWLVEYSFPARRLRIYVRVVFKARRVIRKMWRRFVHRRNAWFSQLLAAWNRHSAAGGKREPIDVNYQMEAVVTYYLRMKDAFHEDHRLWKQGERLARYRRQTHDRTPLDERYPRARPQWRWTMAGADFNQLDAIHTQLARFYQQEMIYVAYGEPRPAEGGAHVRRPPTTPLRGLPEAEEHIFYARQVGLGGAEKKKAAELVPYNRLLWTINTDFFYACALRKMIDRHGRDDASEASSLEEVGGVLDAGAAGTQRRVSRWCEGIVGLGGGRAMEFTEDDLSFMMSMDDFKSWRDNVDETLDETRKQQEQVAPLTSDRRKALRARDCGRVARRRANAVRRVQPNPRDPPHKLYWKGVSRREEIERVAEANPGMSDERAGGGGASWLRRKESQGRMRTASQAVAAMAKASLAARGSTTPRLSRAETRLSTSTPQETPRSRASSLARTPRQWTGEKVEEAKADPTPWERIEQLNSEVSREMHLLQGRLQSLHHLVADAGFHSDNADPAQKSHVRLSVRRRSSVAALRDSMRGEIITIEHDVRSPMSERASTETRPQRTPAHLAIPLASLALESRGSAADSFPTRSPLVSGRASARGSPGRRFHHVSFACDSDDGASHADAFANSGHSACSALTSPRTPLPATPVSPGTKRSLVSSRAPPVRGVPEPSSECERDHAAADDDRSPGILSDTSVARNPAHSREGTPGSSPREVDAASATDVDKRQGAGLPEPVIPVSPTPVPSLRAADGHATMLALGFTHETLRSSLALMDTLVLTPPVAPVSPHAGQNFEQRAGLPTGDSFARDWDTSDGRSTPATKFNSPRHPPVKMRPLSALERAYHQKGRCQCARDATLTLSHRNEQLAKEGGRTARPATAPLQRPRGGAPVQTADEAQPSKEEDVLRGGTRFRWANELLAAARRRNGMQACDVTDAHGKTPLLVYDNGKAAKGESPARERYLPPSVVGQAMECADRTEGGRWRMMVAARGDGEGTDACNDGVASETTLPAGGGGRGEGTTFHAAAGLAPGSVFAGENEEVSWAVGAGGRDGTGSTATTTAATTAAIASIVAAAAAAAAAPGHGEMPLTATTASYSAASLGSSLSLSASSPPTLSLSHGLLFESVGAASEMVVGGEIGSCSTVPLGMSAGGMSPILTPAGACAGAAFARLNATASTLLRFDDDGDGDDNASVVRRPTASGKGFVALREGHAVDRGVAAEHPLLRRSPPAVPEGSSSVGGGALSCSICAPSNTACGAAREDACAHTPVVWKFHADGGVPEQPVLPRYHGEPAPRCRCRAKTAMGGARSVSPTYQGTLLARESLAVAKGCATRDRLQGELSLLQTAAERARNSPTPAALRGGVVPGLAAADAPPAAADVRARMAHRREARAQRIRRHKATVSGGSTATQGAFPVPQKIHPGQRLKVRRGGSAGPGRGRI